MISDPIPPALIGPYTLLEEEALAWSILLFQQALFLHPFPLPLPPSHQSLMAQGLLQVRSLERTQEEIRAKDRSLRSIRTYIAGRPDQGMLKYLKEVSHGENQETQEEILGLLKGKPFQKEAKGSSAIDGQTLLALIHEWMLEEWEVEAEFARIEKQEKNLAQGWQENIEEGLDFPFPDHPVLKRKAVEIICPLALTAWRELKNRLVHEPVILLTNQLWVWAENYGQEPDEDRAVSIPLPDLGSLSLDDFQKHLETQSSKPAEDLPGLLRSLIINPQEESILDFQKALSGLGWPAGGRYNLVLPPVKPSSNQREADPLILLAP